MKIVDLAGSEEVISEAVGRINAALLDFEKEDERQRREAVEGVDDSEREHVEASDIYTLTLMDLPQLQFSMLLTLNQLGKLPPNVVAIADWIDNPLLLMVDRAEDVIHDPLLKRRLEVNADGIINSLHMVGVWRFDYRDGRLELLNPPEGEFQRWRFSNVNPREITVKEGWSGDRPDGDAVTRTTFNHYLLV